MRRRLLMLPLALMLLAVAMAIPTPSDARPCCLTDAECSCPSPKRGFCNDPESGCGQCGCVS